MPGRTRHPHLRLMQARRIYTTITDSFEREMSFLRQATASRVVFFPPSCRPVRGQTAVVEASRLLSARLPSSLSCCISLSHCSLTLSCAICQCSLSRSGSLSQRPSPGLSPPPPPPRSLSRSRSFSHHFIFRASPVSVGPDWIWPCESLFATDCRYIVTTQFC